MYCAFIHLIVIALNIYHVSVLNLLYILNFQVEICGCENGGNCTPEGTTLSANPLIMNCYMSRRYILIIILQSF